MNLEYVMSGCAYTRLLQKYVHDNDETVKEMGKLLNKINGANNHSFSLLYNAWIETKFGKVFREKYYPYIHQVHADSGGLQIVTKGMTITQERMEKVFDLQGQYADVGMCFDEIPIITTGGGSRRGDIKGRLFDYENIDHYIDKTAKNIMAQIDYYDKMGSDCKAYAIIHGNCYDTYHEWSEKLFKAIPESYYPKVAGVALSGACIGTGSADTAEMMMAYSGLPAPDYIKKNIHYLGVGAVARVIPIAALKHSGVISDDCHVSYDSTTHSCGVSLGNWYSGKPSKPIVRITRTYDGNMDQIYQAVCEFLNEDVDPAFFKDAITLTHDQMNQKYSFDRMDVEKQKSIFAFIASSVHNFTGAVNDVFSSRDKLAMWTTKKDRHMKFLCDVRTRADFEAWKRQFNSKLTSQRIKSKGEEQASLLDLL